MIKTNQQFTRRANLHYGVVRKPDGSLHVMNGRVSSQSASNLSAREAERIDGVALGFVTAHSKSVAWEKAKVQFRDGDTPGDTPIYDALVKERADA